MKGSLDTQSSPDFQPQLLGLIDQGAIQIVLDFEKLAFIGGAGLQVLPMAAKQPNISCNESGGRPVHGQLRGSAPYDE